MRQSQSDESARWEKLPQPLHFAVSVARRDLLLRGDRQKLPAFRGFPRLAVKQSLFRPADLNELMDFSCRFARQVEVKG